MMKSQNHQVIRSIGKPLTEAEKKQRVIQFVQQKREAFAINILQGLCTNMGKDATNRDAKDMVALSVEMADALFEALYPIPENKEK